MEEYNILFRQIRGSDKLSYNIASILGAALNKKIGEVDSEVGDFLHNKGYGSGRRNFKLFSHRLRPLSYQASTDGMLLTDDSLISWNVRFYDSKLAKIFEKSMLLYPKWNLGDQFGHHEWEVVKSEQVHKRPRFSSIMKYRVVNPAVISISDEKTRKPFYLTFKTNHELILKQIKKNLSHKAQVLYGFGTASHDLEEGLEDMSIKILNTPKRKQLTFKETQKYPQKFNGNIFDFELVAPREVQELIYYGGFMEKTAMGCGYLKVI